MLLWYAQPRLSAAVCVAVQEEGETGQAQAAWQGAAEEGRRQAHQAQVRRPLHQADGAPCRLTVIEAGMTASAAVERRCGIYADYAKMGCQLGAQHAASIRQANEAHGLVCNWLASARSVMKSTTGRCSM